MGRDVFANKKINTLLGFCLSTKTNFMSGIQPIESHLGKEKNGLIMCILVCMGPFSCNLVAVVVKGRGY